jgi:hypothetical protein
VGGGFWFIRRQPGDIRVHVMVLWRWPKMRGKTARRNFVPDSFLLLHENRWYAIRAAGTGGMCPEHCMAGCLCVACLPLMQPSSVFVVDHFVKFQGVTQM